MRLRRLVTMTFAAAAHLVAMSPVFADAPQPASPAQGCTLPAKRLQRLELIFGLSSQQGPVTARAWSTFLAREVTPRFPEGFSVFDGTGQWRNKAGKIGREASRLLLIWYEADAASDEKIEAIRNAYKKRFHQESVLRANEVSCVSF